jgi:putative transposase
METTTIRRAYRYRLEPSTSQHGQLERFAGARRFVWNWTLAAWRAYYAEHGCSIPMKELSTRLTVLKSQPDTVWLREMDSQALQQTLADLGRAFANFFAHRARYPRFKSKKRDTARFRIPQRVAVSGTCVSIPKIGLVPLRLSRPVDGMVKSATFSRDACGHWFVSLSVQQELPLVARPLPAPATAIGIDLGLKDAVVLSTGERVEAPRLYRKAQKRLKRAQRALCRKVKGSKNRAKARARVARLHQKVANQRQDFLHKLTTRIVRSSGAACIEDLNVKGLARTKLAKSMLDAGMGELRRQLEYKGQWYGVPVVAIDRWFPSSKRCHDCGHLNHDLQLSDRAWTCLACGSVLDRDLNAALNIRDEGYRLLALGHRDSLNACRAPVRLSTESVA